MTQKRTTVARRERLAAATSAGLPCSRATNDFSSRKFIAQKLGPPTTETAFQSLSEKTAIFQSISCVNVDSKVKFLKKVPRVGIEPGTTRSDRPKNILFCGFEPRTSRSDPRPSFATRFYLPH